MEEIIVKQVVTSSFEMEYVSFGKGTKPLVVIPGLSIKSIMHSAKTLPIPYKIFTEDYTLYFFDRIKNFKENYSLEDMAEDQVKALEILGLTKVSLLGNSQGGMIAQYIAAKHPEIIDKLILGCTTSKPEPEQIYVIGNWVKFATENKIDALIEQFITDCFSEEFASRYKRALKVMYRGVSPLDLKRFIYTAKLCDTVDTVSVLKNINCPILVLGAENDRVVTCRASLKIADKLTECHKRFKLHIFNNAAHGVFDESKEYKETIFNFLKNFS